MRFLYSLLFFVLLPLVFLRLLLRSRGEPAYRRHLGERLGFVPAATTAAPIWIHAVSAGETIAAAPLVHRLLAAGHAVLVTNMTPAGRERCEALFGDAVTHCYAPYDVPFAVDGFLSRTRPRMLVIIDTELWPNMTALTAARGIPVIMANARLSAKSHAGYARLPRLFGPLLQAMTAILVQTRSHAERFDDLGVSPARLQVAGSIKFDNPPPADAAARGARLRERVGARRVLLGASTHPGEESAMLDVFAALRRDDPDMVLVLAPRHVVRAEAVVNEAAGYGFEVTTLSRDAPVHDVLVIDAMGELAPAYVIADVALVGGSLAPVGGHNLIEAAELDAAVIMGPHIENIEDLAEQFIAAGAMLLVNDREELLAETRKLWFDAAARDAQVTAARNICDANRGALQRVIEVIEENLP